jgi:hypothetical protein
VLAPTRSTQKEHHPLTNGEEDPPVTAEVNLDQIVSEVSARLRTRFPDRSAAEVESAVQAELDSLADRPVQDYLSVLTERAAKSRLKKSRPDA